MVNCFTHVGNGAHEAFPPNVQFLHVDQAHTCSHKISHMKDTHSFLGELVLGVSCIEMNSIVFVMNITGPKFSLGLDVNDSFCLPALDMAYSIRTQSCQRFCT